MGGSACRPVRTDACRHRHPRPQPAAGAQANTAAKRQSHHPAAFAQEPPTWAPPGTLLHDVQRAAQARWEGVREAARLERGEQAAAAERNAAAARRQRGINEGGVKRLWRCVKGKLGTAAWREDEDKEDEERRRRAAEKGKGVEVEVEAEEGAMQRGQMLFDAREAWW